MINQLKRIAGVIWILLGPLTLYYLVKTALAEIRKHPVIDTRIQWSVFVIIFIPIIIGMIIFGWYCLKGEYDHLPESSNELD